MNATIRVNMQLPRGTFREIKKNQKTGEVLEELERGRFSGICSISCRDEVSTLVLKSGKCILAEYSTFKGDDALENLVYTLADDEIDAALSSLDDAQIQLSLEFNKAERIIRTGHAAPATQKPSAPPVPQVHRTVVKKTGPDHTSPMNSPKEKPAVLTRHLQEKVRQPLVGPKNPLTGPPASIRTPPSRPGNKETKEEHSSPRTETESDLDTFDTMDLEEVTGKFKDECKTMVKNLHLEHLMERD